MPFARPGGVAGKEEAKEDVSICFLLCLFYVFFGSSPRSFYEIISDANWMCIELRTSTLLAETARAMPIP